MLLYQGITILRDHCDWEPELPGDGYAAACDWEQAEIAVVPADLRHPLLREVGPFTSRSGMPTNAHVPSDGVCVLLGQKDGASRPVAWARESRGCRQFHTSLGSADDFRQSGFCRLLTNAVAWVAARDEAQDVE